jgi:tetratricopeptide (TPR) repeat protein
MKSISSFAIAAALVAGGASLIYPVHEAAAQKKKAKAPAGGATATAGARQLTISKEARPALKALETAVKAKDEANYATVLAAAQTAATTADEKYFVAKLRLEHGLNANNTAEQLAALETVVAEGAPDATELPRLHQSIGVLAFNAANWQRSHDAFAKVVELDPNNRDALINLALTKTKLKRSAEALPLMQQAIASAKAAGVAIPEAWYRNALQLAYEARKPEAVALSREVYTLFPTAENWRNALVVYRDSVRTDDNVNIDTLRLMRASKAIALKNEYYDLAIALSDAGLPGEAKAVLEESVAANLGRTTDDTYRRVMTLVAAKVGEDRAALPGLEARAPSAPTGRLAFRTADALLGYGEYAKAAALYRVAISKGGADVDTGLANTRLGIALALAGNKAEAETVLKGVTGTRAALAAYWLDWLGRRPA